MYMWSLLSAAILIRTVHYRFTILQKKIISV